MWFKQNEQKSPQQPETPATPAPRPHQTAAPPLPPAPVQPVAAVPHAPVVPAVQAPFAHASRITSGITLKGEVSGKEDLWIGGNVEGKLRLESARVVVGQSGRVHGDIEAREVVIEGKLDGNLRAADRLEISATGSVHGDAAAPRVALHDGAVFNGSMEVARPGESRSESRAAGVTSRTVVAPKGSRFQTAQAAGAAAAASTSSPSPSTSSPASSNPSPDGRENSSAAAPSILLQGLSGNSSEPSE